MTLTGHRGGSPTTRAERPTAGQSLSDLAKRPEVQLALDNNAFLRVAENLIHLRRYRDLTQGRLAKRVKTSQAAIARIEGASENITLRTLERLVGALKGRLQLSISPAEVHLPTLPEWWDLIAHRVEAPGPYVCRIIVKQEDEPTSRVAAGWKADATGLAKRIDYVTIAAPKDQKLLLSAEDNPAFFA